MQGSIDLITVEGAIGWIFAGREPVVVQALMNGQIIGQTLANAHRPDLAEVGLGNGDHGFNLAFSVPVSPEQLPLVVVRPEGGNVELPRTNSTGYPEFFRAVFARFPSASRSRSVFGGLWTDRTDAEKALRGKLAIGVIPADIAAPLEEFVRDGFALLVEPAGRGGFTAADAKAIGGLLPGTVASKAGGTGERRLLEALPDVLFQESPLRLLHAVLEDHPVACRVEVLRGGEPYRQASTIEPLPSPADCLRVLISAGTDRFEVDIVRESHTFAEFTEAGRSRWVEASAAGALEIALQRGASIETVEMSSGDLMVIGPGLLHRVRTVADSAAVSVLCVPSRQTPVRFLTDTAGMMRVKHASGAMLVA